MLTSLGCFLVQNGAVSAVKIVGTKWHVIVNAAATVVHVAVLVRVAGS